MMQTRLFNNTAQPVSEIGLGTWQLGGAEWGEVSEEHALRTLQAAAEHGVSFIDTADIYGLGRAESLIGRFLASRSDRERFFIASKLGKHPEPGPPGNYSYDTIKKHTEDSLNRLGVSSLPLTQLHTLPTEVIRRPDIWNHLRSIRDQGLIRDFGASVESMDQALTCLEVEGIASLQIIFSVFRQGPIDALFEQARRKNIALIVRLPLASGLLAGKFTRESTFPESDHRSFNRAGEAFNIGETFAGLPFERGVDLGERIRPLIAEAYPENPPTMAQFALRWCLDHEAVTTIIPGARRPEQARDNALASDLAPIPPRIHEQLRSLYRSEVASHIQGPR